MAKKTQVAFSFDTTGSMIGYLEKVRRDLDDIIRRLFEKASHIEIGIVAHGDYADKDNYITQYVDFCGAGDVQRLRDFLSGVTRTKGGDLPECYELVLQEAQSKFSWAGADCDKALVMIGDAIPHEPRDRVNVNKLDWREEANKLHDMGVSIHSVQCPSEETIPDVDDFWQELAEIGEGQRVSIDNIEHIVEVLVIICMHEAKSLKEYEPVEKAVTEVPSITKLFDSVRKTPDRQTPEREANMATARDEEVRSIEMTQPPTTSYLLDDTRHMTSPGFGADEDGLEQKPWRDMRMKWNEDEYKAKRQFIASRSPLLDESHTYKILLCGAIRAGKSSVINTIFTALRDEIGQIAFNAEDDVSITKKFRVYRLRESVKKRAIRVTLCDTMGFEQQEALSGPSIRDFEYIMDGHIMDGYEFKANDSISFNSPYFKKDPGPMDKVHAVVVVVDAASAQTMSKEVIERLKEVTSKANERDIRWAVVMTKIDQACSEVDRDVTSVFNSQAMQNCVEAIHEQFGVINSNIFPMENYGHQVQVSLPMNILALHTLESILRLADNTLECQAGILPVDIEPPPKIELMDTPWRAEENMDDKAVADMWTDLSEVKPDRVDKLRLCFMGPVGGGKSAFVNSCMSEFYQRIVTFAETGSSESGSPTTTHYREYLLKQGRGGGELDIELIDTMGMAASGGILNEDITTVLDGKANNTDAFNPAVPMGRSDSPRSLDERMHLLVLVVNGAQFGSYSKEVIDKLKAAMDIAKGQPREIPRVVIVTHIDKVCEHVNSDPSTVFRSQQVKKCLEMVHQKLQIPLVDIQPVYNFHNDTEVDTKKSALILQALGHQVERAQDYIAQAPGAPAPKKKGWLW